MKKTVSFSIFIVLFNINSLFAITSDYMITPDSIYSHVSILADDSLEGREVGEPGEYKAAVYIRNVFKDAGLTPDGTDDYFQYYDFIKKIEFGEHNRLSINGTDLELNEDYQPMKQSASMTFDFNDVVNVEYGIKAGDDSVSYNDYAGKDVVNKAVLIKRFSPSSKDNPHIDFSNYESLTDKINTAIEQKAGAVIFYTPEGHDDTMTTMGVNNVYPKDIPIIFLRRKSIEKLGLDLVNPIIKHISGETELVTVRDTAQNVIGYLDSGNDTTIIIGAHYDHLGWGGPTSLYRGKVKMIHNGADDNASGVSALLELARFYAHAKEKLHYSMIFVAFSGEEAGLLGSHNFVKDMITDSSKVRMMINMDMIGRLKDQENGLAILGTGTCEQFKTYFDSLNYDNLKITTKQSGYSPSDQISFYNKGIPVLHLFTGAHEDYHKPTDDVEFIDTKGIRKVTMFVNDIVSYFDTLKEPLVFTKTKDSSEGKKRSKYSVTLGVMPDYVAEVKGLKIDGVVDGRPGQKAGILKGDIVIKLGDIQINDIYDYMNSLGKFKKGDTTKAVVLRNGKEVEMTVIFE